MDDKQAPRALSHDERHAAEAAFAGRPFNPRWSERARAVYEGILKSLPNPVVPEESATAPPVASESAPTSQEGSDRPAEQSERTVPAPIPVH